MGKKPPRGMQTNVESQPRRLPSACRSGSATHAPERYLGRGVCRKLTRHLIRQTIQLLLSYADGAGTGSKMRSAVANSLLSLSHMWGHTGAHAALRARQLFGVQLALAPKAGHESRWTLLCGIGLDGCRCSDVGTSCAAEPIKEALAFCRRILVPHSRHENRIPFHSTGVRANRGTPERT